jgi:site-specific recombinase XerD
MVSTAQATDLARLIQGYRLCAQTEGKSKKTIETVAGSVAYLERFLRSEGLTTDATQIGPNEIRTFILYLQNKKRFSGHPFARKQQNGLSGYTINSYLRSVRAFWSWLLYEEIISTNPFDRIKIPKPPRKVIPAFSEAQIRALLDTIDTSTPAGNRDYAVIVTLLDTALRVSELTNLRLEHLRIDEGVVKVMGKGGKERLIPFGKSVQRLLWRYINTYRPEPSLPNRDYLFLTANGRQLTRGHIQKRMVLYGKRASLSGVRCSPHTLRHTGAVNFLRNGGDVFSLQRLLGHSTLSMTRHYCELADIDVKRAHTIASPVDNLVLTRNGSRGGEVMYRQNIV